MRCRSCKKTDLVRSQMMKERGVTYSGLCLPCASEASSLHTMRRRAEASPSDYMECNDCDKYFKKTSSGRYPKIRVECHYCKSKNIGEVV